MTPGIVFEDPGAQAPGSPVRNHHPEAQTLSPAGAPGWLSRKSMRSWGPQFEPQVGCRDHLNKLEKRKE